AGRGTEGSALRCYGTDGWGSGTGFYGQGHCSCGCRCGTSDYENVDGFFLLLLLTVWISTGLILLTLSFVRSFLRGLLTLGKSRGLRAVADLQVAFKSHDLNCAIHIGQLKFGPGARSGSRGNNAGAGKHALRG